MTGLSDSGRTERTDRAGRRGPLALLATAALGVALAGCMGSGATPQTLYVVDSPSASATASSTAAAPAPALATDTAVPTPTPTPAPTIGPAPPPGPCNASNLSLTIQGSGGIYWQGGGGHALATFALKNVGAATCTVKAKAQPLLLNGDDSILILGPAAGTSSTLTLAAGATLHTDIQTGNLCDAPTIVPPVRVAFMIPGGTGLVVAKPLSASDAGGIPPCLGDPSVYTGSIAMQPLAP